MPFCQIEGFNGQEVDDPSYFWSFELKSLVTKKEARNPFFKWIISEKDFIISQYKHSEYNMYKNCVCVYNIKLSSLVTNQIPTWMKNFKSASKILMLSIPLM